MRRLFKKDSDPFAATRFDGMFKSVRQRQHKHMRHWWQWALLGLFALVIGFAGLATYKYYNAQGKVQDPGITDVTPTDNESEEPFTVLLVGSDSREGLTEEEQLDLGASAEGVSGQRSDTLILARVDPAANEIIMAQFPRDLYVPILDEGEDRINSALQAGPNHLVRTVEDLTGISINKYVQVNIAGFRDLVEAIGGVDVCITEPIPFDEATGIEIKPEEVGMVHFDGDRAIRFVRSRKFTTGDLQRIQNQQRFLSAAIDKVLSVGTLLQPTRVLNMLDIAGENLVTDVHTTLNGLRKLAGRFQSFDPEHYEAYIVPNHGSATIDGASVVAPYPEAMEILFEAIRAGESPAEYDGVPSIDPSTIRVGVYNGAFKQDLGVPLADMARRQLLEATDTGEGPVEIATVKNAARGNYKETTIRYTAETEQMAELISAALPDAAMKEIDELDDGVDVEVIVADEVRAVRIVQILPIPIPPPSDPPPECR